MTAFDPDQFLPQVGYPHETVLPSWSCYRDDHAGTEIDCSCGHVFAACYDEALLILDVADCVELRVADVDFGEQCSVEGFDISVEASHGFPGLTRVRRTELNSLISENEDKVDIRVLLDEVQRSVLVGLALHEVTEGTIRCKV